MGREEFLAEEGAGIVGVSGEEVGDDGFGDPDGEDGHGVVKGGGEGEGGVVEDCCAVGEGG